MPKNLQGEEVHRRFWMVWSPQGHGPNVRHDSYASADAEAQRLAAAWPNRAFIVLAAIAEYKAAPPPIGRMWFEDVTVEENPPPAPPDEDRFVALDDL